MSVFVADRLPIHRINMSPELRLSLMVDGYWKKVSDFFARLFTQFSLIIAYSLLSF